MLAKKFRLPIQNAITKKGPTARGRYFSLRRLSTILPYSRLGVVVSKKVVAKASARNQLRRMVFEFFRTRQNEIPGPADFLLFVTSANRAEVGKNAMLKELAILFKSIGARSAQ